MAAENDIKDPKTRLIEQGASGLYDGSLRVTGAIIGNKYYELIGLSTTTTPATGHARLYLSSSTHEVIVRFDDGSSIALGSATGDITSVTAGYGLLGGGTSGAVTLVLDGNTTSYIRNTDLIQGATMYITTGTVNNLTTVNFTASASTSTFVKGTSANFTGSSVLTNVSGTQLNYTTGTINSIMNVGDTAITTWPIGRVGESTSTINTAGVTASASGTLMQIGSLTLQPGVWFVMCNGIAEGQGGATSFTANNNFVMACTATAAAATTGTTLNYDEVRETQQTTGTSAYHGLTFPGKIININAATTYYLNISSVYTSTAPKYYGFMTAIRIR